MPISEPTAVFSIRDDRDMEIKQAVLQVYRALEEKGYNPINQLVGYILSEDPTYITTKTVECKKSPAYRLGYAGDFLLQSFPPKRRWPRRAG